MKSEQQWKTFSTFESRGLDGMQNTVAQLTSVSDRHLVNSFALTDKRPENALFDISFNISSNTELIA